MTVNNQSTIETYTGHAGTESELILPILLSLCPQRLHHYFYIVLLMNFLGFAIPFLYLNFHVLSDFSQNPRMIEIIRDLWRSSGLRPLLKQGYLEPVAQDHVSRDEESTTSLGILCWCSVTFTAKQWFLMFRGTSQVSVCAHCL